ncbi:MAG TPA: hypothetical protein VGI16_11600 [Candidatus Acidoferrum sp.]
MVERRTSKSAPKINPGGAMISMGLGILLLSIFSMSPAFSLNLQDALSIGATIVFAFLRAVQAVAIRPGVLLSTAADLLVPFSALAFILTGMTLLRSQRIRTTESAKSSAPVLAKGGQHGLI